MRIVDLVSDRITAITTGPRALAALIGFFVLGYLINGRPFGVAELKSITGGIGILVDRHRSRRMRNKDETNAASDLTLFHGGLYLTGDIDHFFTITCPNRKSIHHFPLFLYSLLIMPAR